MPLHVSGKGNEPAAAENEKIMTAVGYFLLVAVKCSFLSSEWCTVFCSNCLEQSSELLRNYTGNSHGVLLPTRIQKPNLKLNTATSRWKTSWVHPLLLCKQNHHSFILHCALALRLTQHVMKAIFFFSVLSFGKYTFFKTTIWCCSGVAFKSQPWWTFYWNHWIQFQSAFSYSLQ